MGGKWTVHFASGAGEFERMISGLLKQQGLWPTAFLVVIV
jgi:hypothetical protein